MTRQKLRPILVALGVIALLYIFLVSIGLVGGAFKLFGKELAKEIFGFASNPLTGLFIGVLTTSLVQSSSSTTSIVVGLVAGGMPVPTAIPIIMGANIGTSVTNTLVSLGHVSRSTEFQRAFAASTVHDFFNLMAVILLFPLQYYTNFLGELSSLVAGFLTAGGAELSFPSPLAFAIKPVTKGIVNFSGYLTDSTGIRVTMLFALAAVLLFFSLKHLTGLLRSVVMQRAGGFFERTVFRTPLLAFAMGAVITAAVQSSSVTTSVVVPLAGAGLLTLRQIFPFTLGANVGTTITALLASLAVTTNFGPAVTVAFSHVFFNLSGIVAITALPPVRRLPILCAETLARMTIRHRWIAFLYIFLAFFAVPLLLIYMTR